MALAGQHRGQVAEHPEPLLEGVGHAGPQTEGHLPLHPFVIGLAAAVQQGDEIEGTGDARRIDVALAAQLARRQLGGLDPLNGLCVIALQKV
ncbi:MAG: hypothetical protein AW09_001588 [Candidatus Accumulibacter phosphatis]|uniref:Uncharacterized protein n=1 Tax=Candidatus Accumulibacter phosphatis TaxID=327160 RepID=A0A080M7T1_9PROT|nr:MAG: hypothetical protein AW09_001588 [Candidatus Accumulibacter phosphatis]